MPFKVVCPGCGAGYELHDTLKGKKIRCKQCEESFVAEERKGKKKPLREEGLQAKPGPSARRDRDRDEDEKPNRGTPRGRTDDEDEDEDDGKPRPRQQSSGPGKVTIILGSVGAVLLLSCCGGVFYFGYWVKRGVHNISDHLSQITSQPNGQIVWPQGGAPPGWPVQVQQFPRPTSVADALAYLKSTDPLRRRAGADFLATAPADNQLAEVSKALDLLVNDPDPGVQGSALRAVAVWGTPENVPALLRVFREDIFHKATNELAMRALGKIKDPRGADVIIPRLDNAFEGGQAMQAMQDMGPVATKAVLAHLNDPKDGIRDKARSLLRTYGALDSALLEQCLSDLQAVDAAQRMNAADWLAKSPADEAQRPAASKGLDPLLKDSDGGVRNAAMQALLVWAGPDNVPTLVTIVTTNDAPGSDQRHTAMQVLARLKDERGAAAIAQRLPEFLDRSEAIKDLQIMGPVAEKEVAKYVNHPDVGVRDAASKLLMGYGTKGNVAMGQTLEDLKSTEASRRQAAAEALTKMAVDDKQQAQVALALDPLIIDADGNVQAAALRAVAVWGTKDNVPSLVKAFKDGIFHKDMNILAMKALAKIKDERGAAAVVQRLPDFFEREAASEALQAMGPVAEVSVIPFLGHNDGQVRLQACKILQAIGTKASLPLLKLHAARDTDAGVKLAAAMAMQVITQRP